MSGYRTILMESVSDCLKRHLHICDLLKVILQGFVCDPTTPPLCTKGGCCPPMASSRSPDGLTCHLVVPPCFGNYTDRPQHTFLPQLTLVCSQHSKVAKPTAREQELRSGLWFLPAEPFLYWVCCFLSGQSGFDFTNV